MRAIFCGTPDIAIPSLDALSEVAEIVGVVCQPDRRSGRGMKWQSPPVKVRALEMGLEVHQPTKMRDGSLAEWMQQRRADVAVVIAYGRILTAETLRAPRLGCVNLHASILPALRGAAPIQRALMEGRTETGICLMQMDEGMDTGDVLACHRLSIEPDENAGTLSTKLAALAARVTRVEVPRFVQGQLTPEPQDPEQATYAPPITKEDTIVDFFKAPEEIINQIRALSPRPGASCTIVRQGGKARRLKIVEATAWPTREELPPGTTSFAGSRLLVGTTGLPVEILQAQPEGKKLQSASDLKNGRVIVDGDRLE